MNETIETPTAETAATPQPVEMGPRPGDLARRAKAAEDLANRPASLPDMLGSSIVELEGRAVRVYAIRLKDMERANTLIAQLGEYSLIALSGGDAVIAARALGMYDEAGAEPSSEVESGMEVAYLATIYGLTPEQIGAIRELSGMLLRDLSPDEVDDLVTARNFPEILRASGMGPRTPRPAAAANSGPANPASR